MFKKTAQLARDGFPKAAAAEVGSSLPGIHLRTKADRRCLTRSQGFLKSFSTNNLHSLFNWIFTSRFVQISAVCVCRRDICTSSVCQRFVLEIEYIEIYQHQSLIIRPNKGQDDSFLTQVLFEGGDLPSARLISTHAHRDDGFHDHAITILLVRSSLTFK